MGKGVVCFMPKSEDFSRYGVEPGQRLFKESPDKGTRHRSTRPAPHIATLLINRGENLRVIKILMNHKSLATTARHYTHEKPRACIGGKRPSAFERLS